MALPRCVGPLAVAALVSACASPVGEAASPPVAAEEAVTAATVSMEGTTVEVTSTESCSCCKEWVAYLEQAGATVEVTYTDDLAAVKAAAGVPDEVGSCHTAEVGGYTLEGHVPAEAIVDVLAAAPAIDGIGLAGMPSGSPGMPGEQEAPFEVLAFTDGELSAFGSY